MSPRSRKVTTGGPGRTLAVLRCLAAHGPQSLAEVAKRANIPPRAAYRYVEILDAAGIPIRQEPTWPVRYHVDPIDLMRWIGEARS